MDNKDRHRYLRIMVVCLATMFALCAINPSISHAAPADFGDHSISAGAYSQAVQQQTSAAGLWEAANDYFNRLFDTSDFIRLWNSGSWNASHGWLYIASDLVIWLAFFVLPCVLIHSVRRQSGNPYAGVLWLVGIFILVCGLSHLMEALMFWWPAYRFAGLVKVVAALLSLLALLVVMPFIPKAMALRSPTELLREIAQRNRTEGELRQVHAQLEGVIEQRTAELALKNEEMEQFLNTVSHDLKSPVVTCMGLASMLREDLKAGRIEESFDSIERFERSMKRMRQLIDDLLNLSRIGKVRFDLEDFELAPLIASIRDELAPRAKSRGAELQVENLLPLIRGDVRWLTEVFENLIINAIKYGCDNPHPRVLVGSITQNGENHIYIRDNGRGIDPLHHAKVFEPFRRLQSDVEGSGMGLAIVARVIKMHGGRVWIESEVGHGATFWIALPFVERVESATAGQHPVKRASQLPTGAYA